MSDKTPAKAKSKDGKPVDDARDREARLADALRENLRRRKAANKADQDKKTTD